MDGVQLYSIFDRVGTKDGATLSLTITIPAPPTPSDAPVPPPSLPGSREALGTTKLLVESPVTGELAMLESGCADGCGDGCGVEGRR